MLGTGVDWNADDILLGTLPWECDRRPQERPRGIVFSLSLLQPPHGHRLLTRLLANAFISAKCMALKALLDDL